MRTILIGITLTLMLGASFASGGKAQSAPASPERPIQTFASSADVAALIAKAKSERADGQATVIKPLLELGTYDGHLEYRAAISGASVHEKEAEIFYIIDGSGTLVTGGKLVQEQRTNSTNLSGTSIEGGVSRAVAKGDFILVPENTPHWFSSINGPLVLFSIHVPRP